MTARVTAPSKFDARDRLETWAYCSEHGGFRILATRGIHYVLGDEVDCPKCRETKPEEPAR